MSALSKPQPELRADPGAQPLGAAVLRPVRALHAFESCVEQLGTAIRLGAYPHGAALPPERELAALMGVSRATVREAIAALRQAGLLETRRGRGGGTVVRHRPETPGSGSAAKARALPREQMLDALTFRRVVEPGAAAQAAARVAAGELEPDVVETLERRQAEVSSAGEPALHRQADSRFHLALAQASGSPLLMDAVARTQRDLHEMLIAIPVLAPNIDHSNEQHRQVTEAVLAGKAARARRVMEEHCDDTAALLRGLIG